MHHGARADAGDAGDRDMGEQPHALVQRDAGADMAEGADLDARAERGAVFNQGGGMDSGHRYFVRAVMDHGAEFRLGAQRIADIGLAFEAPDRAAAAAAP